MSPSFSSSSGPLSPQLSTGDSIRDKCIELLAAALRTNGEDVVRLPHWQLNKTAAAVLTQSHTHTHTHNMHQQILTCSTIWLRFRWLMFCFLFRRWLQRVWNKLRQHGSRNWRSYPLIHFSVPSPSVGLIWSAVHSVMTDADSPQPCVLCSCLYIVWTSMKNVTEVQDGNFYFYFQWLVYPSVPLEGVLIVHVP